MTIALPARRRAVAVGLLVAAAVGLASLSGCNGKPTDGAPTSAASTPSPSPTPSPTPSSTPTGPVRAPDDPTWTAEQLAAVRTVDAYQALQAQFAADPFNANFGQLFDVAYEPQYSKVVNSIGNLVATGQKWVGEMPLFFPVSRTVTAPATVNGQQEIHVVQCEVDNPKGQYVDQSGARIDTGPPEGIFDLTVQWVESLQGWRVVDDRGVRVGC